MACGISFLSENFVDSADLSLTTGTQNAQFPLDNMKNEANAVKFRSLENSVVVVFDLQQTRTIDTFAIHGDTNGTFGLTTVSIKLSLTTDFTGATAIPITLYAPELIGYDYITSTAARYVEMTLTGTGSFAEVSTVFIGERISLEQNNLSIGSFRYGNRDNSTTSNNKYDQLFVDKRNSTKLISGTMEFCTKSEQQTLDEMFKRHQRSKPLWMIVDKEGTGINDGESKLTIYGYLQDVPLWSAAGGQHYTANLRVNQAG